MQVGIAKPLMSRAASCPSSFLGGRKICFLVTLLLMAAEMAANSEPLLLLAEVGQTLVISGSRHSERLQAIKSRYEALMLHSAVIHVIASANFKNLAIKSRTVTEGWRSTRPITRGC
jgi:hypothetical protein